MFVVVTTLSTNFLRTYIIYRFMRLFFWTDIEEKKKERVCYALFFVLTAGVHLVFYSKSMSIIANIVMLYVISGCYEKNRRKKLFVTLLIYGVNIGSDFLSLHLLTNYSDIQKYDEGFAYLTVILIMFCEIVVEKILMKNKEKEDIPHENILLLISFVSIAQVIIIDKGVKNKTLLVTSGICILMTILLIFYLYDVLMRAYRKLEEQSLMEKQMLIYSHQLDVLMQSEEKVKALRHDMKNHLGELALMAGNQNNEEIRKYIQDMGEYMQNQSELVSCGNKNIDSLLNYLLGQAKKKLNHVEYEVRVPSDLCISAFDLNVILGNLIENAIEAAEQTEDKWMSVNIYYEKGMFSMEIKNSFQHELAVEQNKLLSTKEEKGHGIGLANVRKMVEKYQGFMDVSNTNQIFTVKVMLYL